MEIIKKLSDYLFFMFFVVFGSGIFITWADFKINIELPINDCSGFVVDSKVYIYTGDNFYSIIQKYNAEGKFVESFKVKNTKGKPFRISIDKADNIIVKSQIDKNFTIYPYYGRDKSFIIYNADKSGELKDVNKIFLTLNQQEFEDLGTFYPSIWKLSEPMQKIVEQNFLLKFLSLSSMLIIIAISLMMKLVYFILKKIKNS